MNIIEDRVFEKINFQEVPFETAAYEYCTFTGCNFERTTMANSKFIECTFVDCNLSLTNVNQSLFQQATFRNCKMLGIRFDTANTFNISLSFENCMLNHSSFFGLKLKGIVFKDCHLQEVDFENADLTNSVWENCELAMSHFAYTNLEKSDFTSAKNYVIDPEQNKLKGAKFSHIGLEGLLTKYKIRVL